MPLGTVWAPDTWVDGCWADDTWADAVSPPPPPGGGGPGSGSAMSPAQLQAFLRGQFWPSPATSPATPVATVRTALVNVSSTPNSSAEVVGDQSAGNATEG